MSCIYGKRQNGTAAQGWVSWFVRATLGRRPLTIYGDGLQVRDLLYVDDLVAAMLKVLRMGAGSGETFNVGGGPGFAVSVWAEFRPLLERAIGALGPVCFAERRPGDQDVYVSDIRRVREHLAWEPRVSPETGLGKLVAWTRENVAHAERPHEKER
jgi:CDP-paratose 2-epimerase